MLLQLAVSSQDTDKKAAASPLPTPAQSKAADKQGKASCKGAILTHPQQQQSCNTVSSQAAVHCATIPAFLSSHTRIEQQDQAAAAPAPAMSRLMRACALLDKPAQTRDTATACAISSQDAWQNATAAKVLHDSVQIAAVSHREHGWANVLPAGVRPCRTEAERQALVAGVAAQVASNHASVKPALAAALKQRSGQHAEIIKSTLQSFKTVTGQPLGIHAGKHVLILLFCSCHEDIRCGDHQHLPSCTVCSAIGQHD